MQNVLIVGGGVAGCTVARELSEAGIRSVLIESAEKIGGKVRDYGCKADTKCNQCGVCLTGGLWESVENDDRISVRPGSRLLDLFPDSNGFSAYIKTGSSKSNAYETLPVSAVVMASGFSDYAEPVALPQGGSPSPRLLNGASLEALLKNRTEDALFASPPKSVAFVLCFGSRDKNADAPYCSRVCCGYSTRAAKVIRHYYPECEITMFYMDIQTVNASADYRESLKRDGVTFIRCRPSAVAFDGEFPVIQYEEQDGLINKTFDYAVLCGGIHPSEENSALSDITGLCIDENGFLRYNDPPEKTRVYLAGTVSGPKSIRETAADAKNTAARLIENLNKDGERI